MRLKAQKFAESIFNDSRRGVNIKPMNVALRKLFKNYSKKRHGPFGGSDALFRSMWQKYALSALEIGLKKFPTAAPLLKKYLLICCEREQFARIMKFISPRNKQLYETLIHLHISTPDSSSKSIDDCQKHALAWLAEIAINKNFDDPQVLWQLSDMLEHAGKTVVAKKIYAKLSKRTVNTPDNYLYAGLSEVRLGNVENGFRKLELGLVVYPEAEGIKSALKQLCFINFDFKRYLQLTDVTHDSDVAKSTSIQNFYREIFKMMPPETFSQKLKSIELNCDVDAFRELKEDFLKHLNKSGVGINGAKLTMFFSQFLDTDAEFCVKLLAILHSMDWGRNDKTEKYLLELIHKLTPPMTLHHTSDTEAVFRKFIVDAQILSENSMILSEPNSDIGKHWYPWQSLFCLAQPRLYHHAMSAFQALAFRLWPKLDYTAPHIHSPPASQGMSRRKIRIGFTVLDSMPMMSGFVGLLDRDVFETVFLRPGARGESVTAGDWIARADTTVEYSSTNAYSAIQTIASQELDILISGPSAPQIFFPLMARLAHLQMVLLEPNWLDGICTNDYYISWQKAEPEHYTSFYRTKVSLLQNPPYWIEKSSLGNVSTISDECSGEIRQRLLGIESSDRFYICANTPPKIHPLMDDVLLKILEIDVNGYLVFLRNDHNISQPLKVRLRDKLEKNFDRVIFLNTLKKDDAHSLILSADCCLDSYPLCGMSSSFDGLMLGVPIVTLPADIPFGRWTAAIYEYIGVSDLTARNVDEYVSIAVRLANDKNWRLEKSAEIRAKSSRYVESGASFDEFQHFLLEAWRRKQAGLTPGNWVAGEWR